MKNIFSFLFLFMIVNTSVAQSNIDSILDFTLSYRGLTRDDITIPINFDKEKSPTNDSKLLLPIVKDIMTDPMNSFAFMDSVMQISNLDLIPLLEKIYRLKEDDSFVIQEQNYNLKENTFESLGESLIKEVKSRRKSAGKITDNFSSDEKLFLQNNLLSIIGESENEDNNNSDIFKFNKARDSSIAVSKRTMDILNKDAIITGVNDRVYDAEYCYKLYKYLSEKINSFDSGNEDEINNDEATGSFLYYYNRGGIRIAIGGNGKNIYTGHFDFIIDIGGDDVYNIDNETSDIFKK